MSRFYLKKLGEQEMGSPKPDGSISRGRYIYISKDYAEEFFPHLSRTITNDSALLPIIPPFENKKVYSKYVYHNDKFNVSSGTRNEYRVYLNQDIDLERRYYKPNDIVVFEKYFEENIRETGFSMPVYFMYRFEPNDENYEILDNFINESSVKGNHALVENILFEIETVDEERIEKSEVIISDDAKAEIIEQQEEILSLEEDGNELETIRGAHLFNSSNFREFVLLGYGYKCAITKKAIVWKGFNNLEAAHIKPKAQAGTFLPCNGIALCRDMHWAFDKGFLTVSDDFKVIIHEEVRHTFLGDFQGEEITIPVDAYFRPAQKFLQYHRENIFGLFKYSGIMRRL